MLIVFECKKNNIRLAIDDLKAYSSRMADKTQYKVYYVAFVSETNYVIMDHSFSETRKLLKTKTFNINIPGSIKIEIAEKMKKQIHDIHNYIRDNTKINGEDKSFFISIVLISLQKESFVRSIKDYGSELYIYDLMIENIKEFELDTSVFEFLRKDNNNVHFRNIITKCLHVLENSQEYHDLLNDFYTEFVRYNNSDSKNLGIVLTPTYICQIMTKLLNIHKEDTVLDLCTGTGSFLLHSLKYNPKKLVGCEYQTKLFNLLKCNMILQKLNKSRYEILKNDCFDETFQATKSIINPPFSMKDKTELDFVLKQLESLPLGGLAVSIFPVSKINSHSKQREELARRSKIKCIITCNEKVFYPTAGVKCCILLLQKCDQGHCRGDKTKLIDFSDDGMVISRNNGWVPGPGFSEKLKHIMEIIDDNERNLFDINIESTDWSRVPETIYSDKINSLELRRSLLDLDYTNSISELYNDPSSLDSERKSGVFRITDLFDVTKKPRERYGGELKLVNLVSARNTNNGVKHLTRATRSGTFHGNKIVLVTGGDGGAGCAFYQENDFMITSATIVLIPTHKIALDKYTGIYVANELSKYRSVYSRGYQWNLDRITRDTINLPITAEGHIDYSFIANLFAR